ncbi:hypothetical protein ACSX1A_15140 [Pontibacter sp. MBLB2868]|uniref:hypothetical protein n=1 Tax=Pontibacter sp. MBLB2868 TaxID=3451555 RepID=UPI003F756901
MSLSGVQAQDAFSIGLAGLSAGPYLEFRKEEGAVVGVKTDYWLNYFAGINYRYRYDNGTNQKAEAREYISRASAFVWNSSTLKGNAAVAIISFSGSSPLQPPPTVGLS